MTFKKQLIEAYKAGIRKALSLVVDGYDPILGNTHKAHFSSSMVSNCHQIDHFDSVTDFDSLIDKTFGGMDGWNQAHNITTKVLGKQTFKLWSPFLDLAKSYAYYVKRGGYKKVGAGDNAFSDLYDDLAQCHAGIEWAKRQLIGSDASRQDIQGTEEAILKLKQIFNHIGFECRVAGRRTNPNWDK